jgi:hypothetical protein
MIYVLLFGLVVVGTGIYLAMFSLIPGAVDERFGVFDALPENLGEWSEDPELRLADVDPEKYRCEVRYLLQSGGGLLARDTLVKQVRLRDRNSNEIARVLPEERIPRRRKRS